MAEDEEYDSDNSGSTVLLADFVDNPQKIDAKRRRFSNLHDSGNQTDEFDDENTAPGDVSENRRTGISPDKKRNNVDKNWHIAKYFACINKNNDINIKNNDSIFLQNLAFNGKQVRSDIHIKQGNISKGNSTNIISGEIICLDSDDEAQIDDNSLNQDIKSVEISARFDFINSQNLVHKPAPVTSRRATTNIGQNKTPQTEEKKYPKLRVLKPCAINARRATTHFDEYNINSNVIGKTTSMPKSNYTENENEIESNGYRNTPRLSVSRRADVNTSTNTDCNNIGLRTTAVHNNTRTSSLVTSIQPLKTDINQNNGLINKGPRQNTNIFLNVNTHKRCGSYNATQTEPKRIKVDAKSIEPAKFNKNTPSNDLKITGLMESGRFESSELYVDVRSERDVMRAEHKATRDDVGNGRSTGQNASESKNTTGAVNEKRAPVNTTDAKTESTVNSVMSDKTIPNKATQMSVLSRLLHKVGASKMFVNLTPHKNKAANNRIERSDGSSMNENSTPIAKTFNKICQNMGTCEAGIIQETYESVTLCDKKETTKMQDVIHKLPNKQTSTKVIDNQETSKLQAALDGSEVLDKFETSIERETSEAHDKQETNKVQDDPKNGKPSDIVHDNHEVSKVQSGCKINQSYENHDANETLVKTVPNKAHHEQETGKILDKGKSSEKQEINKVQDGQVTRETNTPEKNGIQDNHDTCKRQTIDNPDIRKKRTETVTSNILNEKEPSQILDMTIVGETNDEQETDKVYDQLETNDIQDNQIPNVTSDKQESVQVEVLVRENNIIEIQHRQEAQEVSNAYKTTGSTNVQETVNKNEATSKASRNADDENVFLLKFHVHFFTEVKEYLKDIFPESAMELQNIIETLSIDARNGQVQKDVKYGCPKCSRVSKYSSHILNNVENEVNKTSADGSQTCGFCNGIRKLHNSYLKKYLANKYSVDEKKENVKIGKDHTTSVGQSRDSSVGEIIIGNSQTTTEAKTDNNLASTLAGENSSCSSIINNDKQVGNQRKENNHFAQERPVPNETPSINISQLDIRSTIDNNINKAAINITTQPVVSGTDAVNVSDQVTPITKDKLDNFNEEASSKTVLGLKRKCDITYKEATDSKLIKSDTEETKASKESINNQIVDEEHRKHSSSRVSNDECNESETGKSHGIDNDISITSANEKLTATCTAENGKQGTNELSTRYINNDKQSTENTAIESTQICCSNINKEKETDSEDYCIKASQYTVKKKKERITKLFGDENEASGSSKIKASSELFACQKEYQTTNDRDKKTEKRRRNRKTDVVHRRRKVTVKKYTESAESSDTSDSDWIISNDESSDSSDSCDEFCTVKKQQVITKLFSREKNLSLLNGTSDESSTESGENNYDEEDEETIKSTRYTVKKKNERLLQLFGDDNEPSVSNEISEEDDKQARSDKDGHRSGRQCVENEEGNNQSVPSNNEQQIPSDDETLKVSEQTIKKKKARISNYFSDDNEALVQNNNQQMEKSDMHNAGWRVPTDDDSRTKDVKDRFEDTQCRVERPEMIDHRINNENCVNEMNLQETSSTKNGTAGATDRNGIIAVAEEENKNAVKNAESKSRDDDRIEINMIDRLLKEFASDDNRNGTCADKENDNKDNRKAGSGECLATSQTAKVKNSLAHIRITNVTSVGGKTNVYICQECNYGTDTYDDAIHHCQNHYNQIEDQVTYCGICQINYDAICFERHQSTHDKYLENIKIKFSYHWLFTNWQVVFEKNNISLSDAEDTQVKSIYKTFCVKMAVKEDGPWQSAVYLCIKCNTCVPSPDVEKHVQQKCTFGNYPCSKCDRVFLTYELLKHHEIYHTDDASEIFKTIIFNDQNDESFNSKLRQVKAQSREKPRIADIFKCLCGLCFISLKIFKLHFAYCDTELDDGSQCPNCPGTLLFSTTELEEHLLLHHSSLNYEFRVQKITFQLESIIDNSELETPLENSNSTDNATQMTSNDEDLNIKADMLKVESLTQTTDEENRQDNIYNTEEEHINKAVPVTSDSTTQKTLNNEVLNIKRNIKQLKQLTNGENGRENTDHVEKEDVNRGLVNVTVPDIDYEDLIIKRDMLKGETLTQNTNEENSQEILDTDENEDIIREGNSQEISAMEDSENPVDTEASEVMVVEQSINPINIEDSQEVNEVHGGPITINVSQEMTLNDERFNIKRNVEQLKQLTNGESGRENTDYVEKEEVNEAPGGPIAIDDGSQEMEVEESTHPITIEDSDEEDVQFISGSFPDTSKIFNLT